MDVRHPLTDHDQTMLALARQRGVPVHIVLTKADKLGGGAARQTLAEVRKAVDGGATVQLLSALTGAGVAEARGVVLRLLDAKPEKETPAGPADPTGASEPGVGG
jgi:GTP-binding protein